MRTKKCSPFKISLIGTLIVLTTMAMSSPPDASAMLAPPQSAGAVGVSDARAADLKTIQTTLESKLIRQRLSEFKLTPDQINARLGQLTDAQVHQTAMQIRTVNPGGDGGLGFLVSVLVIGILVLLFVYLFRRV